MKLDKWQKQKELKEKSNMTNQIQDHDCGTPQGDGCSVCCDQFNEIMNGPKVVYKESDKSTSDIKKQLRILSVNLIDADEKLQRLVIAKVMLELIDEL